jgi:hypothetical protein
MANLGEPLSKLIHTGAISWRGPCDAGPGGRPDRLVIQFARRAAIGAGWEHKSLQLRVTYAWRLRPTFRPSLRWDCRRFLSQLVRAFRAKGHAEGDNRSAQCRLRAGTGRSGGAISTCRSRNGGCPARATNAGDTQRPREGRCREVVADD